MIRRPTIALLLAVAGAPIAARAQPAVTRPAPAALAAALRLVQDTSMDRGGRAVDVMRGLFVTMLKNRTQQPGQVIAIVDQVLMPAVRQRLPKLKARIAAACAADASLADLRALDAFHRSPLGRRALDIDRRLSLRVLPITMARARQITSDLLQARADALRQRGVSL